MNWSTIQKYKGCTVYCKVNGERSRCKITNTHEIERGSKWFTLSFLENKHLTPIFFGTHIGNCNVIYSPKIKRNVMGWHSEEIMNTLELCNPQEV